MTFLELAEARFSVRKYAQTPVEQEKIDASIVGTHMILAAAEQGLGSCWIEWFNPEELSKEFDIPDNLVPAILIDCGYPAEGVAPSPMHFASKEIGEFVTEL